MLSLVNKQLGTQDMHLEVTESAHDVLAKEGWDENFGARPLRRAIQRLIEDPLSEEVLLGRFSPGETIVADADDGRIIFRKANPELPEPEPPALAAGAA